MDCCEGKFHEGNEVLSWLAHQGGNQWFVVNSDHSISPTHSPMKRWGLDKDNKLVLVNEDDKDKILIFENVSPTVDPNTHTLPLIMEKPLEGKAIVFDEQEI